MKVIPVYQYLDNQDVRDVLGDPLRLYPAQQLQHAAAGTYETPFVIWYVNSGNREGSLCGNTDVREQIVTFEVISKSYTEAIEVSELIEENLYKYGYTESYGEHEQTDKTKEFIVPFDFSFLTTT